MNGNLRGDERLHNAGSRQIVLGGIICWNARANKQEKTASIKYVPLLLLGTENLQWIIKTSCPG